MDSNEADTSAADAELLRLQELLLSYLTDGIARGELSGAHASLSEPVTAIIRSAAADAMQAAADEQLARLSQEAAALQETMAATGGHDPQALAGAIAQELRQARPRRATADYGLIGTAIAACLAMVGLGYGWWHADATIDRVARLSGTAQARSAKVARLCAAFQQIDLPRPVPTPSPTPTPSPSPSATATRAAATPPVQTPEKLLLTLGQTQLADLCAG